MHKAHVQPGSQTANPAAVEEVALDLQAKVPAFKPVSFVENRKDTLVNAYPGRSICRSLTKSIATKQSNTIGIRACGRANSITTSRRTILRAVPLLEESPFANSFETIVVPDSADGTALSDRVITCFVNICEAMYRDDATMGSFVLNDLEGAYVLSMVLKANGVMVLLNELLKGARARQAVLNRHAAAA